MLDQANYRIVVRYNAEGQTEFVHQERRAFRDTDGTILHYEWADVPIIDTRRKKESEPREVLQDA